MAVLTRKPTMIALRARHTAFRIVTEIIWGRKINVEPPAPPKPVLIPDYRDLPIAKPKTRYLQLLIIVFGVLCLIRITLWLIT